MIELRERIEREMANMSPHQKEYKLLVRVLSWMDRIITDELRDIEIKMLALEGLCLLAEETKSNE